MANKTISDLNALRSIYISGTENVDDELVFLIEKNNPTTGATYNIDIINLLLGIEKYLDIEGLRNRISELEIKVNNLEIEIEDLKNNAPSQPGGGNEPEDPEPEDPKPEEPVVSKFDFANNVIHGYYVDGPDLDADALLNALNADTCVYGTIPVGNAKGTDHLSIVPNEGNCVKPSSFFVIVPANANLVVTQDSGIGTKVPFPVEKTMTLNGVEVQVYAELSNAVTKMYMYID